MLLMLMLLMLLLMLRIVLMVLFVGQMLLMLLVLLGFQMAMKQKKISLQVVQILKWKLVFHLLYRGGEQYLLHLQVGQILLLVGLMLLMLLMLLLVGLMLLMLLMLLMVG